LGLIGVCTGYHLFPIPYTPADTGLTSLMVITPLTPIDAFIYETLVKTWILVAVTAGLWVITGYYGIHVLRRLEDAYEKRFVSTFVGSLWSVVSLILLRRFDSKRNWVRRIALPAITFSVLIVAAILVIVYMLK